MSFSFPTVGQLLDGVSSEAVELVGLGDHTTAPGFDVGRTRITPGRSDGRERVAFAITWSRQIDTPTASRITALLRALPGADPMRCHMPPFGVRLGAAPDDVRISICFECHNAYVVDRLAAFDASSPPALELLALFRALSPAT